MNTEINPNNIDDIRKLAKRYDGTLGVDTGCFNSSVKIVHEDGTIMNIKNAFMLRYKQWILVFAEHFPPQVFHVEDLKSFEQIRVVPIEHVNLPEFVKEAVETKRQRKAAKSISSAGNKAKV